MITNLRQKLDRLASQPHKQDNIKHDISLEIGGETVISEHGGFILKRGKYPIGEKYGDYTVENIEKMFSFKNRLLFFDTETSGLGAGSYAFLIGLAYYENDALVTEQIFMRDIDDEVATISYLVENFSDMTVVSFNGKSFDVPLIHTRGIINSVDTSEFAIEQIDLLHLSRRIWKNRLESCRLSSIEEHILHFEREMDVSGSLVPELYKKYLSDGRPDDIIRILMHNEYDVVSMSVLLAKLLKIDNSPANELAEPQDILNLGIYYYNSKQFNKAQECLSDLIHKKSSPLCLYNAMKYLSLIHKRNKQWSDAVILWQKMYRLLPDSQFSLEELSKYYEHILKDNEKALSTAEQLKHIAIKYKNKLLLSEAEHRINRLKQKLTKGNQHGF